MKQSLNNNFRKSVNNNIVVTMNIRLNDFAYLYSALVTIKVILCTVHNRYYLKRLESFPI